MVQGGWSVEGRLAELWAAVGGRDRLAELTGIRGPELSRYNSGKQRLGIKNAQRIADALGVSLKDLGQPDSADPPAELAALRREVATLMRRQAQMEADLEELRRGSA